MASFAAVAFPLCGAVKAAGTDLSTYPAGTLRYLTERGLIVSTASLKVGRAFDSRILNAVILPTAYPIQVMTRLIKHGYVVGG